MKTLILPIVILLLAGCKKEPDVVNEPPPNPQPVNDSITVLDRIVQPSNGSSSFKRYFNDHLVSYGRYSSYFDTTTIKYDANGKITSTARYLPGNFGSKHRMIANIFEYQNNRLTRVLNKFYRDEGEYDSSYLTGTNPNEITQIDSFFYNNNGKVDLIKRYQLSQVAPPKLFTYFKLGYFPANDSLIQKIEFYDKNNNSGGFLLSWGFSFYEFSATKNPMYNLIPQGGLLMELSYITPVWFLEHSVSPYGNFLMLDNPRLSTRNSISSNITYIYNADSSLVVASVVRGMYHESVSYLYRKEKK